MVNLPQQAPKSIVLTKAPITGPIRGTITGVYSPGGSPIIPTRQIDVITERPPTIAIQVPKAPANIVLTKAPTNAPITGKTISIKAPSGSSVIPLKNVEIISEKLKTGTGKTPANIVLTKAPTNAPITGKTLENQGLRVFGGNVVSDFDLKTISYSDILKKDAEKRAAKGDIISSIYLASDNPKVILSPAWMEERISEAMKSVGIDPETQYGKPGGPTVGDWRGDILVEATKGATLDFIPGTGRTIAAGLQAINLMKDVPLVNANEIFESVKKGGIDVVTTMVDTATVNPARFAGSIIPGLLIGKAISAKIPKTTGVKTSGFKVTGGKTTTFVKGNGKTATTQTADLSASVKKYIAGLPVDEQWVITDRWLSGDKITITKAKSIVNDYRKNITPEAKNYISTLSKKNIEVVTKNIVGKGKITIDKVKDIVKDASILESKELKSRGLGKYGTEALERMAVSRRGVTSTALNEMRSYPTEIIAEIYKRWQNGENINVAKARQIAGEMLDIERKQRSTIKKVIEVERGFLDETKLLPEKNVKTLSISDIADQTITIITKKFKGGTERGIGRFGTETLEKITKEYITKRQALTGITEAARKEMMNYPNAVVKEILRRWGNGEQITIEKARRIKKTFEAERAFIIDETRLLPEKNVRTQKSVGIKQKGDVIDAEFTVGKGVGRFGTEALEKITKEYLTRRQALTGITEGARIEMITYPYAVVKEILRRWGNGEQITKAKARRILDDYKKNPERFTGDNKLLSELVLLPEKEPRILDATTIRGPIDIIKNEFPVTKVVLNVDDMLERMGRTEMGISKAALKEVREYPADIIREIYRSWEKGDKITTTWARMIREDYINKHPRTITGKILDEKTILPQRDVTIINADDIIIRDVKFIKKEYTTSKNLKRDAEIRKTVETVVEVERGFLAKTPLLPEKNVRTQKSVGIKQATDIIDAEFTIAKTSSKKAATKKISVRKKTVTPEESKKKVGVNRKISSSDVKTSPGKQVSERKAATRPREKGVSIPPEKVVSIDKDIPLKDSGMMMKQKMVITQKGKPVTGAKATTKTAKKTQIRVKRVDKRITIQRSGERRTVKDQITPKSTVTPSETGKQKAAIAAKPLIIVAPAPILKNGAVVTPIKGDNIVPAMVNTVKIAELNITTNAEDVALVPAQSQIPAVTVMEDSVLLQESALKVTPKQRLLEAQKLKFVPVKIPRKKRIKPKFDVDTKKVVEKKKSKKRPSRRSYVQVVNRIPWLEEEGEDYGWMFKDLKLMKQL